MNKNHCFRGTQGEEITNPSKEALQNILSKDKSYWESGSGDAGITLEGRNCYLIFFKKDGTGIFVMNECYEAPIADNNQKASIEHYIGGEVFATPQACYHTEKAALDILQYFIENGKYHPQFEWTDIYELIEYSSP